MEIKIIQVLTTSHFDFCLTLETNRNSVNCIFFDETILTALGIAIEYACKHTNCLALIFSGHVLSAYVDTWHEGDSKMFLVRGVLKSELLLKKPILAVKT